MTSRPGATAIFTRTVAAAMDRAPLVLPATTALFEAIAAMRLHRQTCLLVTDTEGALAGILTEQDIVRRAAYRLDSFDPVTAAMSAPVRTLDGNEYLYRAVGQMRRFGHRHMPIVDAERRPVGILTLDIALLAASARFLSAIDQLTQDSTESGLALAKQAQAEFAWDLLVGAVACEPVSQLKFTLNRENYREFPGQPVPA
jgi:CBS domain-containing protein